MIENVFSPFFDFLYSFTTERQILEILNFLAACISMYGAVRALVNCAGDYQWVKRNDDGSILFMFIRITSTYNIMQSSLRSFMALMLLLTATAFILTPDPNARISATILGVIVSMGYLLFTVALALKGVFEQWLRQALQAVYERVQRRGRVVLSQ